MNYVIIILVIDEKTAEVIVILLYPFQTKKFNLRNVVKNLKAVHTNWS